MKNKKFSVHISAILSINSHLDFLKKVREFSGSRRYPESTIDGSKTQGMSTELAQLSVQSINKSLLMLQENEHPDRELAWIKNSLRGLVEKFEEIATGWGCPTDSVKTTKRFKETIESLAAKPKNY